MHEIRHYLTPEGKDVVAEWQLRLHDARAKIAIDRRINRLELGNLVTTGSAAMASGNCASYPEYKSAAFIERLYTPPRPLPN